MPVSGTLTRTSTLRLVDEGASSAEFGSRTMSFISKAAPGLLVTRELKDAIAKCESQVDHIAEQCRREGTRFRDIEFDLEMDMDLWLNGLSSSTKMAPWPMDTLRITEIFDNPTFFANEGPIGSSIIQGSLGDCWFLSALATVAAGNDLIEKLCVKHEAEIGVYGFIFFRDNCWVTVVIDDILCVHIPPYEALTETEKRLYHFDKDRYNKLARKGGETLSFARSGNQGETWVPLIEKAFAKLHGGYAALDGGQVCEASETLTGGISSIISTKDILDLDKFWKEELCRANSDRIFGCSFPDPDSTGRSGKDVVTVHGLRPLHSYSVSRAVEVSGKRFVIVRNPWGKACWDGRWSDGSKEWTDNIDGMEPTLAALKHTFSRDGQFVMEYSDWLQCFQQVDRTLLFHEHWTISSVWLHAMPSPMSYGDLSFQVEVQGSTPAIIAVSPVNNRSFREITGGSSWAFDFSVYKEGAARSLAQSSQSLFKTSSVHVDLRLDPGIYMVYVRFDHHMSMVADNLRDVPVRKGRKLDRILADRARSLSVITGQTPQLHYTWHKPMTIEDIQAQDQQSSTAAEYEVPVTRTTDPSFIIRPVDDVNERPRKRRRSSSEPATVENEINGGILALRSDAGTPGGTSTVAGSPFTPALKDLPYTPVTAPASLSSDVEAAVCEEARPTVALSDPVSIGINGRLQFPIPRAGSAFVGLKVYTRKDFPASITAIVS